MHNSTLVRDLLIAIFPTIWIVISFIGTKRNKELNSQEFISLSSSTALKGFAALGIILHHITQMNTNYAQVYKGPTTILDGMGIIFTTIFFFLSGFGLVTSYLTKKDYLKGFLLKRLPSVLIPFLVSNIIYFLFYALTAQRIGTAKDIICRLTGWALLNTNTWFLVEIIILYLVFFFTFRFISNKKISMTIIFIFTIILITVSLLLGHDHTYLGGHWFMGEWWYNTTIMFFVGMCVAFRKEKLFASFQKLYWLKFALAATASVVLFTVQYYALQVWGYWSETPFNPAYLSKTICLISQTAFILMFALTLLIFMAKFNLGNPVINFIGKISLELYIIHEMFRIVFGQMLGLWDAPLYACVFAASIPAAIALHYFDKLLLLPFRGKRKSE